MSEEQKPRRKLTVADHIAIHDERISRLSADLEAAKAARADYIAGINAKAAELTGSLPRE